MSRFAQFNDKTILVTGGTGSFGQAFIEELFEHCTPKKLIVFSRDEWKQSQMQEEKEIFRDPKLRYFLGDVRDKERLKSAFREVDFIIHAAALKQVPAAEYNPSECIKTNILGTLNVMEAAIEEGVEKVALLSTDKSVSPVNLYGASKLCAEKLILSGSVYVGNRAKPQFCVVRYGNVLGSKGSLIPKWQKALGEGATTLPITDRRMTRFWMTLKHAVHFVMDSLLSSKGGEIYVPKLPSLKIEDLAKMLDPRAKLKVCGIRAGEKLHEHLITKDEALMTLEFKNHFVVQSPWCQEKVPSNVLDDFEYCSNHNTRWLTQEDLIEAHLIKVAPTFS